MNGLEQQFLRARADEIKEQGSVDALRAQRLGKLTLKAIVKEHHQKPIGEIAYNNVDEGKENMVATVGGSQATIYDDELFGNYITIITQFTNEPGPVSNGEDLHALSWLHSGGTSEPFGDSFLAVGGGDGVVFVISIVEGAVIRTLRRDGVSPVSEISANSGRPELLLARSSDGTIRLWDWHSDSCLVCLDADAVSALAMHPTQGRAFFGSSEGGILCLDLPSHDEAAQKQQSAFTERCRLMERAHVAIDRNYRWPVDKVHIIGKESPLLLARTSDGACHAWDLPTGRKVASVQVPGSPTCTGDATRALAGTTDARFAIVGSKRGVVHLYDIEREGREEIRLEQQKVRAPVHSVDVSFDGRHLLAAIGNGFIFRYEYLELPFAADRQRLQCKGT